MLLGPEDNSSLVPNESIDSMLADKDADLSDPADVPDIDSGVGYENPN